MQACRPGLGAVPAPGRRAGGHAHIAAPPAPWGAGLSGSAPRHPSPGDQTVQQLLGPLACLQILDQPLVLLRLDAPGQLQVERLGACNGRSRTESRRQLPAGLERRLPSLAGLAGEARGQARGSNRWCGAGRGQHQQPQLEGNSQPSPPPLPAPWHGGRNSRSCAGR